jgi:hypothetical protein
MCTFELKSVSLLNGITNRGTMTLQIGTNVSGATVKAEKRISTQ